MRETALALMPQAAAISAAVQRVLSPGGGLEVNATTRSATSGPSGAMREGRVLSRSKPSTPSCMNRSCQRQTQVLDLRVRRMISLVPRPSAESSTTSARQTCFCGAWRSFKITFSRLRSEGFNVMDIPVRTRQTRTSGAAWESQMGFKCQTETTRSPYEVKFQFLNRQKAVIEFGGKLRNCLKSSRRQSIDGRGSRR